MPDEDTSRVVVSVELPPGAPLEDTRVATDNIVKSLRDLPRCKSVFVLGGTTPTGQLEVRRASVIVQLVPKTERDAAAKGPEVRSSPTSSPTCRTCAPGTSTSAASASCRSRCCRTTARSWPKASAKLEARLRGCRASTTSPPRRRSTGRKCASCRKLDEAARLGVAPDQIAETIRVATIGDIDANLAKFNAGDRLIPIRVQIEEKRAREHAAHREPARHQRRRAPPSRSRPSPTSPSAAARARSTATTASAAPSSASISSALRARHRARDLSVKAVEEQKLPAGVRLQPSGDAEIQDEVATGFMTAMGTGLMIVFGC